MQVNEITNIAGFKLRAYCYFAANLSILTFRESTRLALSGSGKRFCQVHSFLFAFERQSNRNIPVVSADAIVLDS